MPEYDLKLICDAMPCSYVADISTQAHNIYKAITGLDVEFDIQVGGDLPQLFAPTVTQTGINWSVTTNTQNGGWASTIVNTATIDGEPINIGTPLTDADNGKTLVVTSSHDNFASNSTTKTVSVNTGVGLTSNGQPGVNSIPSNKTVYIWTLSGDGAALFASNYSDQVSYTYISVDGGLTWTQAPGKWFNLYYVVSGVPTATAPDLDKIRIKVVGGSSTTRYYQVRYSVGVRLAGMLGTLKAGVVTDQWQIENRDGDAAVNFYGLVDNKSDVAIALFRVWKNDLSTYYSNVSVSMFRSDTGAICSYIRPDTVASGSEAEYHIVYTGTDN